jgi:hypothetical protein
MTAAHVVDPTDENRHTPDADDLWNESYYADFVHADGSVGGWLRLGLYPNRQVAWWTTWIVGPGRAGVCSVNYAVPVPAGTGLVATEAASDTRIELVLADPLRQFGIVAAAPAEVLEHPEDAYGDGDGGGIPARLEVDLTWTTDGTPYHYDLTTRYEIPCTVAGTVTVDGVAMTVAGQGQRDHSWGVRDWWAFGWCWSSARLDDGTRVHLADIRMPGFPIAFGYVQHPPTEVHPITELSVTEEVAAHGFPTSARLEINPGGLGITVTPIAFGPVLLRNDDGRTSRFPRAMVRYEADDGREGLGWIEWNQPDGAA